MAALQDNGIPFMTFTGITTFMPKSTKPNLRTTLNDVKHMYFGHRYRQCISRCIELLESQFKDVNPLVKTYLYFYIALSYDTLARGMHNFSASRLPTLQDAEHYFDKALSTLPVSLPIVDLSSESPQVSSCYMDDLRGSLGSSGSSPYLDYNRIQRPRADSTMTDTSSFSLSDLPDPSSGFLKFQPSLGVKKPSPLRVRKVTSVEPFPDFDPLYMEPPATPQNKSAMPLDFPAMRDLPRDDSTADLIPTVNYHIYRYNSDLEAFRSMLHDHISSTQLLKHAFASPALSRNVSSGSTLSSNTSTSEESRGSSHLDVSPCAGSRFLSEAEKVVRIKSGRERGWVRKRFDSKKYKELCEHALAEL